MEYNGKYFGEIRVLNQNNPQTKNPIHLLEMPTSLDFRIVAGRNMDVHRSAGFKTREYTY